MTKKVVGVRFKKAGKIYYFDPQDLELNQYDHVVVETVQGMEYGEVALTPREVDENLFSASIKPVVRKATERDDSDYESLKEKEARARTVFEEKVKAHNLDMKLINVEYTFDKKKAIFYFTAEGRVDFRSLVKDLASIFRVRIELRQIGVRDEAKIFNTLGVCGRNTCCSQWLGDFTPVSIKMAKEQSLSLNATKISGICGRLLCCLTYEHEFYKDVMKKMPKVGQMVNTPDGVGQVYRLGVLQESVAVRMQLKDDETEIRNYPMEEVTRAEGVPRPQKKPRNSSEEERGDRGRRGAAGSGNSRRNNPSHRSSHPADKEGDDRGEGAPRKDRAPRTGGEGSGQKDKRDAAKNGHSSRDRGWDNRKGGTGGDKGRNNNNRRRRKNGGEKRDNRPAGGNADEHKGGSAPENGGNAVKDHKE
jgi:cell fate regulator YaaT (PSP1 superfamily)